MVDELPSSVDLIIVGTGLIECIVSAAASRIGKTVLHLDSNDFYGGHWASFNIKNLFSDPCKTNLKYVEDDSVLKLKNVMFDIKDFCVEWHIPEKNILIEDPEKQSLENNESESKYTQEDILKEARKYNIDLMPKLHFARGEFVELLISSNIARYAEYRSVSRILTWLNGQLEEVPCSRSDVFASKKVSIIEKRLLMKLLTSINDNSDDLNNYQNKTFLEYLKDQKLTDNLINFVLNAISRSSKETQFCEGVTSTKRFLNSLGRFGKTPFLFSMYGSGETPQAFCRLSAVFGGIFALNQNLKGIKVENNKISSLFTEHQEIQAEYFVVGLEYVPTELIQDIEIKKFISRAVFITDRSVRSSEQEHLTLFMYPPENNKNIVTILELGSRTGTSPKDIYLLHLISEQDTNPKEDFQHILDNLFNLGYKENGKPNILWSCYFSLPDTSNIAFKDIPVNMGWCPGPDMDLDYDLSIKKAKNIFQEIYQDLEFLPRAPDPEEILFGEEEQNNSLEEELQEKLEINETTQ